MIKIDLITGFLGAGKTTFLKKYAHYLLRNGENICILENDYGAVNIDMMLLKELEGERCNLEMISGGCDPDCHRRRFKTKLIAMGMVGYTRVLVEPSGIFDVDEFFDLLHEEPLDRWYEIGNVITIVDAALKNNLSREADYLLAAEAAHAGIVLLSKVQEADGHQIQHTVSHLNRALKDIRCPRRFGVTGTPSVGLVLAKDWTSFTEEDYARIMGSGYQITDFEKLPLFEDNAFSSRYFFHLPYTAEELAMLSQNILEDPECGNIYRIKGFCKETDGSWSEINITKEELSIRPLADGQEVLIVIGENLDASRIACHLQINHSGST